MEKQAIGRPAVEHMSTQTGARIHINGIVQGVGFRPFVYGLAHQYDLTGWVKNTSAGVDIQVEGQPGELHAFYNRLKTQPPPLARIDSTTIEYCPPSGYGSFEIVLSESIPSAFQPLSPDICTCQDCLRELDDPTDRRFAYPFINCTNCGPRFTIIRDIPYDRPNTSMAGFLLCPECAAEYSDPLNRRFHAQPIACPVCGPHIWLEQSNASNSGRPGCSDQETILAAQEMLLDGKILAIKGLGGFHLACDANNPQAVAELRQRKLRAGKPYALMLPDLGTIRKHCQVSDAEQALLESIQRPIVLLERLPGSHLPHEIAPGVNTLGIMLPYTPLHALLFSRLGACEPPEALVMTSGNLSEEPIVLDNTEARQRLAELADGFVLHDRPILIRCDDSVARILNSESAPYLLRRARGYAPTALKFPFAAPPLLATGAELKNTFCLARDEYAFLSQHIGDLQNFETLQAFEEGISHFERLFRVQPTALAYDQHPDYLATRYAVERAQRENLPALAIQHHHAHIAGVLAENHLPPDSLALGVAFDGTGYGADGAIWGGEFLLAGYSGYQRLAHLAYLPLPGGDMAIRKPARTALAQLWAYGLEWDPNLPCVQALCFEERHALRQQLEARINTPSTSSIGRLFDAVAALTGVCQQITYEAQAAIELEALVDPGENGEYPIDINYHTGVLAGGERAPLSLDPGPLIEAIYRDVYAQRAPSIIAARFHNSLAHLVVSVCSQLRLDTGVNQVALSGGGWQNMTLLEKSYRLLQKSGFVIHLHRQVPANDGGLSLGQAAIAAYYYR